MKTKKTTRTLSLAMVGPRAVRAKSRPPPPPSKPFEAAPVRSPPPPFAEESANNSRDSTKSEQIEHTQKFIKRVKKWVVCADEYVQWAQEHKELLEADERLARLPWTSRGPRPPDPATEVQRLQHQFAQAQVQHFSSTVAHQ